MDKKEVVSTLKSIIAFYKKKAMLRYKYKIVVDSLVWALRCVEKQIAKKPIIKQWSPAKCPTCGCDLSESIGDGYYKHRTSLKFCDCGQKIDWSEV